MEKKVEIGALALEAQLVEKAKLQFKKLAKQNVEWIAHKCWPFNLKSQLEQLNELIKAASEVGAINASLMTEVEINDLAKTFAPFRTLEMGEEVHSRLVFKLEAKGIPREIFFPEK
jgi:hypothetical protein